MADFGYSNKQLAYPDLTQRPNGPADRGISAHHGAGQLDRRPLRRQARDQHLLNTLLRPRAGVSVLRVPADATYGLVCVAST